MGCVLAGRMFVRQRSWGQHLWKGGKGSKREEGEIHNARSRIHTEGRGALEQEWPFGAIFPEEGACSVI